MKDIEIRNLNKAYGDLLVFRDYNAIFPAGKVTTIMAPSGAGKTTLLHMILGLEQMDSGEILGLEGLKISAVFQEDRLCEELTVRSNLEMVLLKKKEDMHSYLREVGLEDVLDKKVSELSGGMKRRVAIVRAFLVEYDLLVLDEPFRGLDEELKQKVMDFVWRESAGKTVLLVTHDAEEGMVGERRYNTVL